MAKRGGIVSLLSKTPPEVKPVTKKMKVLGIDDDEDFNVIMAHRFNQLNCEYKAFTKVADFLQALMADKWDLILVDLNLANDEDMPSGYQIIEEIRTNYKISTPIIIVSGVKDFTSIAHCLELGANDYLVKPPSKEHFVAKVSEYLPTANTSGSDYPALLEVEETSRRAEIDFSMEIVDISNTRIGLRTSHLVRKGAAFRIKGELIQEIFPGREHLLVTVLGSATVADENSRSYLIQTELDATDVKALEQIKIWLNMKRSKLAA